MPSGPRASLASIASVALRRLAGLLGRLLNVLRWLLGRARELGSAFVRRWGARPGERGRTLRRLSGVPLPNLYEVHPEVRRATPREIGLRSIDLEEIVGTAVAGAAQRGSDFLPLPAFRSSNWMSRWQRILRAIDNLAILPPVDLVRYDGKYWVLDGHNRVAAAHRVGQVEVDANVTELVPPGQNPSERPTNLAAALTGTTAVRAAGRGERLRTVRDDEVMAVRPGEFDGQATAALRDAARSVPGEAAGAVPAELTPTGSAEPGASAADDRPAAASDATKGEGDDGAPAGAT